MQCISNPRWKSFVVFRWWCWKRMSKVRFSFYQDFTSFSLQLRRRKFCFYRFKQVQSWQNSGIGKLPWYGLDYWIVQGCWLQYQNWNIRFWIWSVEWRTWLPLRLVSIGDYTLDWVISGTPKPYCNMGFKQNFSLFCCINRRCSILHWWLHFLSKLPIGHRSIQRWSMACFRKSPCPLVFSTVGHTRFTDNDSWWLGSQWWWTVSSKYVQPIGFL